MNLERVQQLGVAGAEVARGLERALEAHSADHYRLGLREDDAVPRGLTIELTASDSSRVCAAVRIHVHPQGGHVWVTVGEGLEVELPTERTDWLPLGLDTLEKEIRGLCAAAIRGDVEETVTTDAIGAIESEGTITIEGRAIPVATHYGGHRRRGKRRKRHYDYQPYVPSQ